MLVVADVNLAEGVKIFQRWDRMVLKSPDFKGKNIATLRIVKMPYLKGIKWNLLHKGN